MKKNKIKKILLITLSVILSLILIFYIYIGNYYHADEKTNNYLKTNNDITITEIKNGYVFEPKNASIGFVFYPGGKVEAESYAPLLFKLAENGYFCILLEVPFNLAILGPNRANIKKDYPNIQSWYMMGHSLGGTVSGMYLEKNHSDFEGLILLGSYITSNLSDTDLNVLSIYGEQDKVLNKEKYINSISNLPTNYKEEIIQGGCHAYFGLYGNQKGDGNPTISAIEQIEITVNLINNFIK